MKKQLLKITLASFVFVLFTVVTKAQISTVAGSGAQGCAGDGGQAMSANFYTPIAMGLDQVGNIYIADVACYTIRKINAITGVITKIAGTGIGGTAGDGGLAINAEIHYPNCIAIDAANNIYFTENFAHKIRKIDAITGIISTIAGTGVAGYSGDGSVATSANLYYPHSICFDPIGNLIFTDRFNNRIRKINKTSNIISTIAGTNNYATAPLANEGELAINADLAGPSLMFINSVGDVFFLDYSGYTLRKIDAVSGILTTIAGTGGMGNTGNGGLATNAEINWVGGLCLDSNQNIYLTINTLSKIRKINANTGIINIFAGTSVATYSGDGGPAISAGLNNPISIRSDSNGDLFFLDRGNFRVRKIVSTTASFTTSASTCVNEAITFTNASTNATSYTWQFGEGSTSTNTNPVFVYTSVGTYTVKLIAYSVGGNDTITQIKVVSTSPTATITTSGTTTFCIGSSVTLNTNTSAGLSYQWQLNGTNISSATTASYTANASGNYAVKVSNGGCSAISPITSVTVNSQAATITAAGATTFCTDGNVILNANTGAGLSYQWKLNGTNISGETSSSYTATETGNYTVMVSNVNCSGTSAATIVTENTCAGITKNINEKNSLVVYPNPTNNKLNVSYVTSKSPIQIIDVLGKVVQEQTIQANQTQIILDVSNLNNGLYFIKNGSQSAKFFKE